jgi:hypothetical protein
MRAWVLALLVFSAPAARADVRCEHDLSPGVHADLDGLYDFISAFTGIRYSREKGVLTMDAADPSMGEALVAAAAAFSRDPSEANRAEAVRVITAIRDEFPVGVFDAVRDSLEGLRQYVASCQLP